MSENIPLVDLKAAAAGPNKAIIPKIRETFSSNAKLIDRTYARTTYAISGCSRISLVVDAMAISRLDAASPAERDPSVGVWRPCLPAGLRAMPSPSA